ncbi:MAG: tRNA lysidine(34) synthetase TilS [Methylovirgula sp.]
MLSFAPAGAKPAANLDPFTTAEIAALFAPLVGLRGALLAVSGGPDSVAMMLLAATWAETSKVKLAVATVDHGLRDGSRAEAEAVATWAQALGLPHRILTWDGEKPVTAIQERAREARYDLLFRYAEEIGVDHLLTAHHADDQAETILFRFLRGSGIAGLAGMQVATQHGEITHLRPFLAYPKEALVGVCASRGQAFFRDPSNEDSSFARTRLRRLLRLLAEEGITRQALLRLGRRAARAEFALAAFTRILRGSLHGRQKSGQFCAAIGHLRDAPEEIMLRLVAHEIEACGGGNVRLERLESLLEGLRAALHAGASWRGTLAGMRLALSDEGILTIAAEKPRRRGIRGASTDRPSPQAGDVKGGGPSG